MITRVLILYDVKRKQNTALDSPEETSEETDGIALE